MIFKNRNLNVFWDQSWESNWWGLWQIESITLFTPMAQTSCSLHLLLSRENPWRYHPDVSCNCCMHVIQKKASVTMSKQGQADSCILVNVLQVSWYMSDRRLTFLPQEIIRTWLMSLWTGESSFIVHVHSLILICCSHLWHNASGQNVNHLQVNEHYFLLLFCNREKSDVRHHEQSHEKLIFTWVSSSLCRVRFGFNYYFLNGSVSHLFICLLIDRLIYKVSENSQKAIKGLVASSNCLFLFIQSPFQKPEVLNLQWYKRKNSK